jgi:hypothetical protein
MENPCSLSEKREPGTKSVIQDSRLKAVAETAHLTAGTDQVIANKKE